MADPIIVTSLRGGMNDTDAADVIGPDQTTLAVNTECFYSMVGERRAGCSIVTTPGAGANYWSYLYQWYPTNDPGAPGLFGIAITEVV